MVDPYFGPAEEPHRYGGNPKALRSWRLDYPDECRTKQRFGCKSSRPPWINDATERPSIDYIAEGPVLYPPWVVNLAAAKLEAYIQANLEPGFPEIYVLKEAALQVALDSPPHNVPLNLVKYVTEAAVHRGIQVETQPIEWNDGKCAVALLKPHTSHQLVVTTRADETFEVNTLGIGITWYEHQSYPSWFIMGKFWNQDHLDNSIQRLPDSFDGHIAFGDLSETVYAIEEPLNYAGSWRVLDLLLDYLKGRKPLPVPATRGYGSSWTDTVVAAASAVSALASVAAVVVQTQANRQQSKTSDSGSLAQSDRGRIPHKKSKKSTIDEEGCHIQRDNKPARTKTNKPTSKIHKRGKQSVDNRKPPKEDINESDQK